MSLAVPGLHFGVWRSPLQTADHARPVIERIAASEHVWLDGIMGYEAQVAGVGDNYPGQLAKNTPGAPSERALVRVDAERRAAVVALAESLCGPLRFVNGGGTGSMATTRAGARRHRDHGWVGILQPRALRQLPRFSLSTSGGLRHRDRAHPRAGHLHLPGRRLYRVGRRGQRSAASGLSASGRATRSAGGRGRGADADSLSRARAAGAGRPHLSCATRRRANSASASPICCRSRMARLWTN